MRGDAEGVAFEGVGDAEEIGFDGVGAGGVVEGAAVGRAGGEAVRAEGVEHEVRVVEVRHPAAVVVVDGVGDAVDDGAVDALGLHGGEGGAEDGAVGETPVEELLLAFAPPRAFREGVVFGVEDGARAEGFRVAPLAVRLDEGDHVGDDGRRVHVVGELVFRRVALEDAVGAAFGEGVGSRPYTRKGVVGAAQDAFAQGLHLP